MKPVTDSLKDNAPNGALPIIMDTTLRDGEQAPGVVLTPHDKAKYVKRAEDAGIRYIEVGFPENALDLEACYKAVEARKLARLVAMALPKKEAVPLVKAVGVDEILFIVPSSRDHLETVYRHPLDQLLRSLKICVAEACKAGLAINIGLEDAGHRDMETIGTIVSALHEFSCDIAVVTIPDTRGELLAHEVVDLIERMHDLSKGAKWKLAFHAHNDLGYATANTIAALTAPHPVDIVHVTTCGFGERAGNASLEQVVTILEKKIDGFQGKTGVDLKKLKGLAESVERAFLTPVGAHAPVIGSKVFTHESGLHQRGLEKNQSSYQFLDPEEFAQKQVLVFGKHSGSAMIERLKRPPCPDKNASCFPVVSPNDPTPALYRLRDDLAHNPKSDAERLFNFIKYTLNETLPRALTDDKVHRRLDRGGTSCSQGDLVEKVLGEEKCGVECITECIRGLDSRQLSAFFYTKMLEKYREQVHLNPASKEDFDKRVRERLGVWYASSLLTEAAVLDAKGPDKLLDQRIQAIARESLRWHTDSFLAHVVVYYKYFKRETARHGMALFVPASVSDRVRDLGDGLVGSITEYVQQFGASVRTQAHLRSGLTRMTAVPDLTACKVSANCRNVPAVKQTGDGYFGHLDDLILAAKQGGREDEYQGRVANVLKSVYPQPASGYGQMHLAAGSHLGNVTDPDISAVAHMYVLYTGAVPEDGEYILAMRELLGRLATTFALDNMRNAYDSLQAAERETAKHNALLTKSAEDLLKAVHVVEDKARGVQALTANDPWRILQQWIKKLQTILAQQSVNLGGRDFQGKHDGWTEDDFALALLFLVSARDIDLRSSSPAQVWRDYCAKAYDKEVNDNPIWLCLARKGLAPTGLEQWLASDSKRLDEWKDGLRPPERNTLYKLLFAIGADRATPDLTWDKKEYFELCPRLEIDGIATGLNHLCTALLSHQNQHPVNMPTRMAAELDLQAGWLDLQLSPLEIEKKTRRLIGLEGWSKLKLAVQEVLSPDGDDYYNGRGNTRHAVLETLGVHDGNWRDRAELVKVDTSDGMIKRRDGNGDVALMSFGHQDGLHIRYRLKGKQGQ
jgi:homocitrate synthase NifV